MMNPEIARDLLGLRAWLADLADQVATAADDVARLAAAMDEAPPPPELLPVREVRRRLALGESTVYEMIADGRLPSVRVGRAVRVPIDAVERFQRHGDDERLDGTGHVVPPRARVTPPAIRVRSHAEYAARRSPPRPVPPRLWHRP
jgi:excisionase family DNA binding protein